MWENPHLLRSCDLWRHSVRATLLSDQRRHERQARDRGVSSSFPFNV